MPALSITANGIMPRYPEELSDQMKVLALPYGPLSSNLYVVITEDGGFIVDPSVSPDKVMNLIEGFELGVIKGVFATHAHYDHICCVDEWHKALPGVPFYLSAEDKPLLSDAYGNCSALIGRECLFDSVFEDVQDKMVFGNTTIDVIRTPGHTKGSVCYLVSSEGGSVLFTGDTVFAGSVGRTDFKGGSPVELSESVNKIKRLDPRLAIYPGHGPDSTIGEEIRTNPYFA